jgi:hypothetical protein
LTVAENLSAALKVPVTIFEMATMHWYIAYGYGPTFDYVKINADGKKEVEEEMRVLNEYEPIFASFMPILQYMGIVPL